MDSSDNSDIPDISPYNSDDSYDTYDSNHRLLLKSNRPPPMIKCHCGTDCANIDIICEATPITHKCICVPNHKCSLANCNYNNCKALVHKCICKRFPDQSKCCKSLGQSHGCICKLKVKSWTLQANMIQCRSDSHTCICLINRIDKYKCELYKATNHELQCKASYHSISNDIKNINLEEEVKKDPYLIRAIRPSDQTVNMCMYAVSHDPHLLKYCEYINIDMIRGLELHPVLKHLDHRYKLNYIFSYPINQILKIVNVYPNVIKYMYPMTKTIMKKERPNDYDRIIRTALTQDGYVIKFVDEQTDEYITLATKSQPDAIRYVKTDLELSKVAYLFQYFFLMLLCLMMYMTLFVNHNG